MVELAWTLIGTVLGVFASSWAAWFFACRQYRASRACWRVEDVKNATRRFAALGNACRSADRDRYRYSLGVLIDELEAMYGVTTHHVVEHDEYWPLIIPSQVGSDPSYDRWSTFNRRARPVVDDLNPFLFLTVFWWRKIPLLNYSAGPSRDLELLARLCMKIEIATALLDAAFEAPIQVALADFCTEFRSIRKVLTPVAGADPARIHEISRAMRELREAWNCWVTATQCNPSVMFRLKALVRPIRLRSELEIRKFRHRLLVPGAEKRR